LLQTFEPAGIEDLGVANPPVDDGLLVGALKKDPAKNMEDALREIYKRLRAGEPVMANNTAGLMSRLFLERKCYHWGRVGRKKLNQRLKLDKDIDDHLIDTVDIVAATKFLCRLHNWEEYVDDIDHLGNWRICNVADLLVNQCRSGLSKMGRLIRKRLGRFNNAMDMTVPQKLVNPKIVMSSARDFLAQSAVPVHGPDQSALGIGTQRETFGPWSGMPRP
jgi:DNA-directed RNA polymerase subunit beta